MSIASFNKNRSIDWGFDYKEMPWKKSSDLDQSKSYPLKGCFTTPDSGYGVGAVLITEDAKINISERYVDVVKDIMADADAVAQIKAGKAAFKVSEFKNKRNQTGYNIDFIDVE